ncbi:polysaccharide deacetylase family protein [Planctomycetota bacterium]
MFHDVSPAVAEQTFAYLARHYNIIGLQDYIAIRSNASAKLPLKAMIITFDDGHVGNRDILPILRSYKVPVTIFLCAGIVNTNRHYWFQCQGKNFDSSDLKRIANQERLEKLAAIGFDQEKEYAERQALSRDEILAMSDVDFQAHTVFHPCLPQCTDEESQREIADSKRILETEFSLPINAFAFPNGDYGDREIEYLREAGFDAAVTVKPGFNTLQSDPLQLGRFCTNDASNMDELIVKASGLWGWLRLLLGKSS